MKVPVQNTLFCLKHFFIESREKLTLYCFIELITYYMYTYRERQRETKRQRWRNRERMIYPGSTKSPKIVKTTLDDPSKNTSLDFKYGHCIGQFRLQQ